MGGLTASISVGLTKQVQRYEPINIHVSIQGVTPETPMEEIAEFCDQAIPEAIKTIGRKLEKQINAEVERLRNQ